MKREQSSEGLENFGMSCYFPTKVGMIESTTKKSSQNHRVVLSCDYRPKICGMQNSR